MGNAGRGWEAEQRLDERPFKLELATPRGISRAGRPIFDSRGLVTVDHLGLRGELTGAVGSETVPRVVTTARSSSASGRGPGFDRLVGGAASVAVVSFELVWAAGAFGRAEVDLFRDVPIGGSGDVGLSRSCGGRVDRAAHPVEDLRESCLGRDAALLDEVDDVVALVGAHGIGEIEDRSRGVPSAPARRRVSVYGCRCRARSRSR